MSVNDKLTTPQTIPDAQLPVEGVRGSRFTVFLRATPQIFTVLLPGHGNADVRIRAYVPIERPQHLLGTRFLLPLEPVTTLKTLAVSISGSGALTANFNHTRGFFVVISGEAVLAADLLKDNEIQALPDRPDALRSLRRRRRVWKEWQS